MHNIIDTDYVAYSLFYDFFLIDTITGIRSDDQEIKSRTFATL